ncbi:MAG TPA: hypothetical protein VLF68_02555 [Candidatus Saccharimonadales bacterium]|nr:hypothetical protein [Candidatus Saccharimonadales bacterium]
MRKHIHKVISHPLISGSTVLVIGSFTASVINYLFNRQMGVMLGAVNYGVFASLVSIVNIFLVFALTIQLVFTKFTASFVGRGEKGLVGLLFKKGTLWVGAIALAITVVLLIFSSPVASILHIAQTGLVQLTAVTLFALFIASVPLGMLQGLLKFGFFSFANISTSLAKLALGVFFVAFGFQVAGGMLAFFISSVLTYLVACIPLLTYLKNIEHDHPLAINLHKQIGSYGLPVFLSTLGITAFTSFDILLVKVFFYPNQQIAGQYAALSLMGRSIFYLIQPISFVLFPLIAQKKERGEKLLGTMALSALLVGVPSVVLCMVYFFLPHLVLAIFFPTKEYAILSSYLGPFSIFILFFSFVSLLNSYYLSIGRRKVFIFTIAGAVLEALYITIWHQSLMQVIIGMTVITFLLLLSLLLYYPHEKTP